MDDSLPNWASTLWRCRTSSRTARVSFMRCVDLSSLKAARRVGYMRSSHNPTLLMIPSHVQFLRSTGCIDTNVHKRYYGTNPAGIAKMSTPVPHGGGGVPMRTRATISSRTSSPREWGRG